MYWLAWGVLNLANVLSAYRVAVNVFTVTLVAALVVVPATVRVPLRVFVVN